MVRDGWPPLLSADPLMIEHSFSSVRDGGGFGVQVGLD